MDTFNLKENEDTCMEATDAEQAMPPDVTISGFTFRTVVDQARQAADDMDQRIKEATAQRDEAVRRAGTLQRNIDAMKHEHSRLTRHHRQLKGLLP